MTGYMNKRYKATHYFILVELPFHKYLEPHIICKWKNAKKSTSDKSKVTCPDCIALLNGE